MKFLQWPVPGTESKPFNDIFDPAVAAKFEAQAGRYICQSPDMLRDSRHDLGSEDIVHQVIESCRLVYSRGQVWNQCSF